MGICTRFVAPDPFSGIWYGVDVAIQSCAPRPAGRGGLFLYLVNYESTTNNGFWSESAQFLAQSSWLVQHRRGNR
jgi:hypothetical protein